MKDVNTPDLQMGEAIIKVSHIGICGTDLHAYKGRQPFFSYPCVLGHELSGVIEEISDDAKVKKGESVTVIPYIECGNCIACRKGRPNCCTNMQVLGVHRDGGMREFLSVPVEHLIPVEGISSESAAIIEPLSIGAHAIRRADLEKGETVLVVGGGPIGLGIMRLAVLAGARVIAMDINEDRLQFSKAWAEVHEVINATLSPMEDLLRMTEGDLPTTVFDATGNKASMTKAFDYAAHGGRIVYVGLVKDSISFNDPDFHKKELTLLSSRNATKEDFADVIQFIKDGSVETEGFISHKTNFGDLIERFESFSNPETNVIKALVEF